jgi:hypothetical protein
MTQRQADGHKGPTYREDNTANAMIIARSIAAAIIHFFARLGA